MESSTSASRYTPQMNSTNEKRVFTGSTSSSSSGFKDDDVEVLEIPPPPLPTPTSTNRIRRRSSNNNPQSSNSKLQQVMHREIIDVDLLEDSEDVIIIDAKVDRTGKGKGVVHTNCPAGLSKLANDGSSSGIHMSKNGTKHDFNSNPYYGEHAWMNTYFDDIMYDDDDYAAILQSQFDHMDVPTGIEAPFPWLPTNPRANKKVPGTSTSTSSTSQRQPDYIDLSSSMTKYNLTTPSIDPKIAFETGSQPMIGTTPSKWFNSDLSSESQLSSHYSRYGKQRFAPLGNTEMWSHGSHVFPGPLNHFPYGATSLNSTPILNGSGAGTPLWQDFPMEPSTGVIMNERSGPLIKDSLSNRSGGLSIDGSGSGRVGKGKVDETVTNMVGFKQFDTVEDHSDHHYSKQGSSAKQAPKNWAKRIQDEWKILEKDLPDTIFVRVYESRMDLLRAVMVGAEGTPYHDGLFFFDVCFPSTYPNTPPLVHYHSGGLRINPNLYDCGKVCLSLLNTWHGGHKEMWIPGVSTMLQVLVSIQGLILNAKPYFNEPGYAHSSGSVTGERQSLEYNERTFLDSLKTMTYTMRKPPKYFEGFVKDHFCKYARDILLSCKAYTNGAQVGSLVKGGVPDADVRGKTCSKRFKDDLAKFITILVNTFSEMGAKDCQEFLSLAPSANGPVPRPGIRANHSTSTRRNRLG